MNVELEKIWQDYGLDVLQENINRLFPEYSLSLEEIMDKLIRGELLDAVKYIFDGTIGAVFLQMAGLRDILFLLLLLGIASSVLTHFVEIFDRHQIADMGYYFMYLLFMMILFRVFEQSAEVAKEAMDSMVLFIRLMVPTYLLTVGVASGVTAAGAYSGVFAFVVYGTECFLAGWLFDVIRVYVLLSMVNGIWTEGRLKMLTDLIHKIIVTALKGALGIVTGISVFQSLISPVISSAQNTMLHKIVNAIPGIGDLSGGVMQLVLGSALIIKNSIGILLLLLLLVLCLAPLVKIFAIAWVLRLAAALMGMVSDKRLVKCTHNMGEGCMLMFRLVGTAMLLFVILISIIAISTNHVL